MFVVSRQITVSHVEAKPDIIVAIFCFFDVSLLGGTLNKHFSRAAPEGKTKGASKCTVILNAYRIEDALMTTTKLYWITIR